MVAHVSQAAGQQRRLLAVRKASKQAERQQARPAHVLREREREREAKAEAGLRGPNPSPPTRSRGF